MRYYASLSDKLTAFFEGTNLFATTVTKLLQKRYLKQCVNGGEVSGLSDTVTYWL